MRIALLGAPQARGASSRILLGAWLAIAGAQAAIAAPAPVFSPDRKMVFLPDGQGQFHASREHEKKLSTIFSNFASYYPDGLYMYALGAAISGPKSLLGGINWYAAPFTPATNTLVKEIDVPVYYDLGTNSFVVGLYSDAGGVPGTLLKSWVARKNDVKTGCCTFTVVKDTAGVPVTAGQQYWIALTTKAKTSFVTWTFNALNNVDAVPYAYSTGKGWTAGTAAPGLAFAVYGQ
jgi:hypothetical protein